ncbi:SPP1 family predicted phage head-tail adaptor [Rhizobium sp. SG_E_25_P2]|uniref:phage head closure protein n=1 Tax=Rhizobium sp. SG_E_25_P2 TaxID=2879942 RepID=UPI002475A2CF|nr:phage head closure protein [Rhizobium sp. SG_E_25_P2]MDH6265534.1 SPP1 family predicted phage head-tail adaptor [Rhizobium sp. SG_E_25_P2]
MSGKTGGGALNERVTLSRPVAQENDYGGSVDGFETVTTVAAKFTPMRGGETLIAARLTGRSVVVARIRASTLTRQARPDWRLTDARAATVYNIRDVILSDDRAYLDLLCESGVAS